MARGQIAKEAIFSKILETFENSFMYNGGKEVRIPWDENGTHIQIKVTLTAAKDNVDPTGEVSIRPAAVASETGNFPTPNVQVNTSIEPTEQEKKNLQDLLTALNLN